MCNEPFYFNGLAKLCDECKIKNRKLLSDKWNRLNYTRRAIKLPKIINNMPKLGKTVSLSELINRMKIKKSSLRSHINHARKLGYDIQVVPHEVSYKLVSRPCYICGKKLPIKRSKFCSDECNKVDVNRRRKDNE